MKTRLPVVFIALVPLLAVLATACAGGIAASTSAPPVVSPVPAPSAGDSTGYPAPGLSELVIRQWQEQGTANVTTAAEASLLAGFNVTAPSYVPAGLNGQMYLVSNHGADASGAAGFIDVSRTYTFDLFSRPVLTITESTESFDNSNTPAPEISMCGIALRELAVQATSTSPACVEYSWNRGGVYFRVDEYSEPNVSESDFDKLICSLINH